VDGSPGILTRKTETNFAIKNGETMVLSGLVNKTKSHADDGVPLLSRIPILGYLFKNREKAQKQTELVFLVTPYTYDQPEKTTERVKDTLEKELDGESQLFLKAPQKEDQKALLLKTGE
jgi:pilus assembly protein CpaC